MRIADLVEPARTPGQRKQLATQVAQQTHEALKRISRQTGHSMAEVIDIFLTEGLATYPIETVRATGQRKQLATQINRETHQRLKLLSRQTGRSMSEIIELLLTAGMERHRIEPVRTPGQRKQLATQINRETHDLLKKTGRDTGRSMAEIIDLLLTRGIGTFENLATKSQRGRGRAAGVAPKPAGPRRRGRTPKPAAA